MQETPQHFQTGDWVYVGRHWAQLLEPQWKEPFLVLLTTPTALKVDGIAAWVHTSHVLSGDLCWMVPKIDNPLKF